MLGSDDADTRTKPKFKDVGSEVRYPARKEFFLQGVGGSIPVGESFSDFVSAIAGTNTSGRLLIGQPTDELLTALHHPHDSP